MLPQERRNDQFLKYGCFVFKARPDLQRVKIADTNRFAGAGVQLDAMVRNTTFSGRPGAPLQSAVLWHGSC